MDIYLRWGDFMRLAIIGYGNVGKAFVKLIEKKKEMLNRENLKLQVNYIISSTSGIYIPDGIDLENVGEFTRDIDFQTLIRNQDVDLVVEITPTNIETGQPGLDHIRKSLEAGFHVVTANKGPILLSYGELKSLADSKGLQLGIGCTTGGALPTINGGVMDLAGSEILKIEGVLNGTTNFILEEMENSHSTYEEALHKAQELGIAETNPSLDVEGWDTGTKLLILANVLMDGKLSLDDLKIEGITKITTEEIKSAKLDNKRYKLIGSSEKVGDKINAKVSLELLDSGNPLYSVTGKNKAVRYTTDIMGELTITGGASGLEPAAASILRDIINIHRGYRY